MFIKSNDDTFYYLFIFYLHGSKRLLLSSAETVNLSVKDVFHFRVNAENKTAEYAIHMMY